jgi:hypothetical protein
MRLKTWGTAFFIALTTLIAASPVIAQQNFDLSKYLGGGFDVDALAQFMFPGLPPEWLRVPQVFWYVILPFIAVFTVIYGLFKELRIFRHAPNKVNIVLAFAMAMLLLPSGVLTFIVVNLYAFSAAFAAIVFGIVFMLGVVLWGVASSWGWYNQVSVARTQGKVINDLYRELKRKNVEKRHLMQELATNASDQRRGAIENRLNQIHKETTDIEERMRAVRRAA